MEPQNTTQQTQKQSRFLYWLKTSITARMLMVGFLIIVLLIPLSYINSLIRERSYRQNDVVQEINQKWGSDILLYGPILKLPYYTYTETKTFNENTKTYYKKTEQHINYAYIFPEELSIDTDVNSKTKYLGNYESAVYTADVSMHGHFIKPSLEHKDILDKDIVWNKASILLQTSNLKGIKTEMRIQLNEQSYNLETNFKANTTYQTSNNYQSLDELETNHIQPEILSNIFNFNLKMTCNGSQQIQVIPVGKTTSVTMASNWADPGFIGAYSPNDDTREITENGFKATWKVLHINRAFSQLHLNTIPNLNGFAFGTMFVIVVDEFQKSERSAKYGFLVIGLTFLIFFLIQTISKLHIHPFQYLMIGLALTMFYTLLVSITEHSNFLKAYIIASAAVVVLISVYSKSILKSIKFAGLIGISLTALYAFIYIIIQLENYALLVGSIGLFIILATVMFISRKIDWQTD